MKMYTTSVWKPHQ